MYVPPEPVDAPSGRSFVFRYYRSGTLARFPSAGNTPGQTQTGGLVLLPLQLLGLLLHFAVFRGQWTVAVTPWRNIPGPRYRERVRTEQQAAHRAAALAEALRRGTWSP